MREDKPTKHPFLVYLIIFSSIFIFGGVLVVGIETIFSSDDSIVVWQNSTHANVTINQSFNITFNKINISTDAFIGSLIICDNGSATIMTRNVTLAQNKGCSV